MTDAQALTVAANILLFTGAFWLGYCKRLRATGRHLLSPYARTVMICVPLLAACLVLAYMGAP